ncbi:MAG: glycosyltransferase [Ruminococcus sp.]|nr:glycosyltransferase [Ruminococcus sp.]
MGISVVLLAYKEAENLAFLLPKIKEMLDSLPEPYEILVIDTKEPLDNTSEVCEKFGARYINQEFPGFGGAFRTGIKYAEMDKFLILDSDGSHDPKYIPAIYKKFTEENCDLVIGSRYTEGGETNDAKSSIIMSHILNTFFRICLGIKAKDISTDYRLYRTEQIKNVKLENVNYDVLQEVLLRMKQNKPDLRIGEVPISFQKRIYGESKRRLIPFIIGYMKSLIRFTFIRYPILRNILLYGVFGGLAFVLDYALSLTLTKTVMKDAPEIASIIGNVAGFIFTFLTNTFWNFKVKGKFALRAASYGGITLFGMGVSTLCIHLLKSAMPFALLKLLVLIFVSAIQFVLNKLITYNEKIIKSDNK